MKVTYTTGSIGNFTLSTLTLENVGVNKFRASIPLQDKAGNVISRTAEVEAASERTKAGTMRVMLKCTIPYFPQILDDQGNAVVDSNRSPKPFTMHIVYTIPSVMVGEVLNQALADQAAQVIAIATGIIGLGISPTTYKLHGDKHMHQVPLQTSTLSVDGVGSYPLAPTQKSGDEEIPSIHSVDKEALAGTFVGRALVGLMPIDINEDKSVPVITRLIAPET